MTSRVQIFSILKDDHRTVKSLFSRISKTTERAQKGRERLYTQLREEIINHARAEENAVYPRLKQKRETEGWAFECIEEHGTITNLLNRLDSTSADSKEWSALMCLLQDQVERHVKEEEGEIFSLMRKAFTEEELQEMGDFFLRAKEGLMGRLANMVAA